MKKNQNEVPVPQKNEPKKDEIKKDKNPPPDDMSEEEYYEVFAHWEDSCAA